MSNSHPLPSLPERLFGPEMIQDPYPFYAQLRESDPIHWDPGMHAWVITRYEDVAKVLNDKRFSSRRIAKGRERFPQAEFDALFDTLSGKMSEYDEPEHKRLRALVHDAFARTAVEEWGDRIGTIANTLLDDAEASAAGQMEFISSYAIPLPLSLILEVVGIPDAEQQQVKAWCDDFSNVALNFYANISESDLRQAQKSVLAFKEFLREHVAALRESPRKDLLSSLIKAQEGESRLTLEELLANTLLILSAGNETTTCLLGNGLHALLEQPEQFERLRSDPTLIPNAVEEFLRFDAPVQFLGRLAIEDVTLKGANIKSGDLVLAVIASANRDPDKFENPDEIDVGRTHLQHMAFGHGHHFCAGSQLSRQEARIAFETLFSRYSSIKLETTHPLEREKNANIRCFKTLPLRVAG